MLDAFALVGMALDEPAADEVERLIRRGTAAVTALNLAEALDQLARVHGHDLEELQQRFGPVLGEPVAILDVDESLALRAAALRGRHYNRRTNPLSLADCVALAAVGAEDSLATADRGLARVAAAEGLDVVALAPSRRR